MLLSTLYQIKVSIKISIGPSQHALITCVLSAVVGAIVPMADVGESFCVWNRTACSWHWLSSIAGDVFPDDVIGDVDTWSLAPPPYEEICGDGDEKNDADGKDDVVVTQHEIGTNTSRCLVLLNQALKR